MQPSGGDQQQPVLPPARDNLLATFVVLAASVALARAPPLDQADQAGAVRRTSSSTRPLHCRSPARNSPAHPLPLPVTMLTAIQLPRQVALCLQVQYDKPKAPPDAVAQKELLPDLVSPASS